MTTAPLPPTTDLADADVCTSFEAVAQQVTLLEKTLRATQLYLPNNPIYQTALERLNASFAAFWNVESEIALDITGGGFEWSGIRLETSREQQEGFAWLLYRDGLRSLTLSPGCEAEELVRFLELVNRARQMGRASEFEPARPGSALGENIGAHDDLLTLLWPEEFSHIDYEFVEAGHEEYSPLGSTGSLYNLGPPVDIRAQIEDDVEQAMRSNPDGSQGIAKIDESASTLHFLDEIEIARLKREIDDEYETELYGNVLAILLDILETQTYGEPQQEVVTILEGLVPHFLALKQYGVVAHILREVREFSLAGSFPTDVLERLEDIPATLSSADVLSGLLELLDDADQPPPRAELGELLGQLRPHAIRTILEWIPKLRHSAVKGALTLALDPIVRSNPKGLTYSFASLGPAATVVGLEVVSRLALRSMADDILHFATHDDVDVRKAAVDAFASLGTNKTMGSLTQLLFDDDREVRATAVEKLAAANYHPACARIETAIRERLRGARLSEKRVFFEAFAVLGGESSVPRLESILNSKRFLRRREDPDTRACAAMALGIIGTPNAQHALQRALGDKELIVRNAAEKAMREIR